MPPPSPHNHHSASSSLRCGEDVSDADARISAPSPDPSSSSPPSPYHSHLPSDDAAVVGLIDSETHHMPRRDYLRRCRDRSIDVTARQDSINWILRVHAHYRFRPITAFLSVNYLDRFLSFHSLPREANGWAFQLLSVACLSLAAKMEEPDVPLLLDLQVFDPKFVFEPRTVQRMELWVMSNLNWRLRSVTPFDFLHSFVPKLPSLSCPPSLRRVLSASSDLIVSTTRVIDFLGFTPSTIAAAAVLCAAGEGGDEPPVFHSSLDREMVRSCRQLMEEYLVDTCPSATVKVAEPEPPAAPPSPVGVLDAAACKSCDTRSDNNPSATTSQAEPPPPPPLPPPNKRLRFSAPESSDVQEH
ncbi:cyclin-D4-1-like isoform X2 [Rhodamnia argentea]|uniref:Cyclin-D4-1-like isoform X2 n=1 Tax=Rhodamnia argentea TaxID=178133 RepID=A0A8B8NJV7_9MYRT|nr:cyclin-D4-1-like isoform X2 [Rhodamnia argentea]